MLRSATETLKSDGSPPCFRREGGSIEQEGPAQIFCSHCDSSSVRVSSWASSHALAHGGQRCGCDVNGGARAHCQRLQHGRTIDAISYIKSGSDAEKMPDAILHQAIRHRRRLRRDARPQVDGLHAASCLVMITTRTSIIHKSRK